MASWSVQDGGELIDQLDDAFQPFSQPSMRASTQPSAVEVAEDEDEGSSIFKCDAEVIQHDEARGVFRSPRPSVTLAELQEREAAEKLSHGAGKDGKDAAPGKASIRGGVFGGNPWDDLWLAAKNDVGSDASRFRESLDLDAEANKAWEEAAAEKYDEIDWKDEDVFYDSDDMVFDDSEVEVIEEASSDEGCNSRA
ncbi:hypothetical protein diail_11928 [Diaporthe ilicicola]|nr:hypothetical protein diail_11928 [Diaporthe ilicicola]